MNQGGFFEERHVNPKTMGAVITMHVAAIGLLAAWKMDAPVMERFTPIEVFDYRTPPPPPPKPETKPDKPKTATSQPTYDKPVVTIPSDDPVVEARPTDELPDWGDVAGSGPTGTGTIDPPLPPPPVRVEAQYDPRFAARLQPPYPPSEQRAQREGTVKMRVIIGRDGKVTRVEKVEAASDAFFRAAERQALRYWRFRPATLGGDPIETSKVMTIRFTLDD